MVAKCLAVLSGVWALLPLAASAGFDWKLWVAATSAAAGLACLARRETSWAFGIGGLLMGGALAGSVVGAAPLLPDCWRALPPDEALTLCMAEKGHAAMGLGARLGGVLAVASAPVVFWSVRPNELSFDCGDLSRLRFGSWLAAVGGVRLVGLGGVAGWVALGGGAVLVGLPTVSAWRGARWLERVYRGGIQQWWIEAGVDVPATLPLLVSGQQRHVSDAVLLRDTGPVDPYRDAAAPRWVARVCTSLPLQLRPLRARMWCGLLLLAGIVATGIAVGAQRSFP